MNIYLHWSLTQSIRALFKALSCFAEDQQIPVSILSVLWVSILPAKNKLLSAMKTRTWVGQLLQRSIVMGTSSEISLHDIVRVVLTNVKITFI